jgi:hypothetical protein
MNPGVSAQPHHVAPARLSLKPAEQCSTGEAAIGQQGDRTESGQETIGLLSQCDGCGCADTGGLLLILLASRGRLKVIVRGVLKSSKNRENNCWSCCFAGRPTP